MMAPVSTLHPIPPAAHKPEPLLLSALAGVLRSAQDGELPLFARTLGMPQAALLQMLGCCFPQLDYHDPIPERKYAVLMDSEPAVFSGAYAMLMAQRSARAEPQHADWLARAFAAACLGGRFLWQDLGLTGREDVAALLRDYFEPLYRRNTADLKWKHFLFLQLGEQPARAARDAPRHPLEQSGRRSEAA